MVWNDIYLPSIEVKNLSEQMKLFRGINVKFLLRDEPTNVALSTHEKQVITFTGEYGKSNP